MGIGDIKDAQERGVFPRNVHLLGMNFIDIFQQRALSKIAALFSEIVSPDNKVILSSDRISPSLYRFAQEKYGNRESLIMPDSSTGNLIKVHKSFLKTHFSSSDLNTLILLTATDTQLQDMHVKFLTLLGTQKLPGIRKRNPEQIVWDRVFSDFLSASFAPYFDVKVELLNSKFLITPTHLPIPFNFAYLSPVGMVGLNDPTAPDNKINILSSTVLVELTRNNYRPKITEEKVTPDVTHSGLYESAEIFAAVQEWGHKNKIRLHRDTPMKDETGNNIRVWVSGLTSESGQKLNGKQGTIESAQFDSKGHLRFTVSFEGGTKVNILGTSLATHPPA